MPSRVYLSLGSNLGDRQENLKRAILKISSFSTLLAWSSIYETQPWGVLDQPDFLNMVVCVETSLPPSALLHTIKSLEIVLGRVPAERYGPRIIDIDILLYDNLIYSTQDLQIPHSHLTERAFALMPLSEIAPEVILPGINQPVHQILSRLNPEGVRLFLAKDLLFPDLKTVPPPRRILTFGQRTFIMGIINITPDSFSGDGILRQSDPQHAAVEQANRFIDEGADILDIGGESTRPGSQLVSENEEIDRILPLVESIRAAHPDILISIDTSKANVAEAALKAGADWVNDVWGMRADPRLAQVAAQYQATAVIMHNRSDPSMAKQHQQLGGRYEGVKYQNLVQDIRTELLESVSIAHSNGIANSHIILDPGIGFGKTVEQNLVLLNRLDQIKSLGFPLLLGVSRKSFIGYTLNLPLNERLEGSLAACAVGIIKGADILRVHDVLQTVRVARMTDAIRTASS